MELCLLWATSVLTPPKSLKSGYWMSVLVKFHPIGNWKLVKLEIYSKENHENWYSWYAVKYESWRSNTYISSVCHLSISLRNTILSGESISIFLLQRSLCVICHQSLMADQEFIFFAKWPNSDSWDLKRLTKPWYSRDWALGQLSQCCKNHACLHSKSGPV